MPPLDFLRGGVAPPRFESLPPSNLVNVIRCIESSPPSNMLRGGAAPPRFETSINRAGKPPPPRSRGPSKGKSAGDEGYAECNVHINVGKNFHLHPPPPVVRSFGGKNFKLGVHEGYV